MLQIFSKQYKYSIAHVHLVGQLKIYMLYENEGNRKLHDW